MQRESPTDATVTTHPSIITNVTVVPETLAEGAKKIRYQFLRMRLYGGLGFLLVEVLNLWS